MTIYIMIKKINNSIILKKLFYFKKLFNFIIKIWILLIIILIMTIYIMIKKINNNIKK